MPCRWRLCDFFIKFSISQPVNQSDMLDKITPALAKSSKQPSPLAT
ncbi:hypothetical protein ACFBZI_02015 [Moraxella sp. ZJ142]